MTVVTGSRRMAFESSPAEISRTLAQAPTRSVERALAELRRGDTVVLAAEDGRTLLVQAAETASSIGIGLLTALGGGAPALVLTGRRARALGLEVPGETPVLLTPRGRLSAELAQVLADPTAPSSRARRAGLPAATSLPSPLSGEGAALLLVKLARLLPAAIVAVLPDDRRDARAFAQTHDLIAVPAADIVAYRDLAARTLQKVVEAEVPLEDVERTRILAFRPSDGGPEHLAIVIGDPAPGEPVLARMHSECFTGDLLGSLRCDCGPQLRGAIREIALAGSGVLLYLAQEGRGIGLINKLRAYRLQDGGLDTVDANTALGFDADERVYLPAAAMLRSMGFDAVRLMTNNPDKLAQLAACGVRVVERVPHIFPSNGHNEGYLRTKAEKSGHMF